MATMKPRAKLYIYDQDREGMFGDGKAELLKAIEKEGSIRKAAKKLGRGYRKAWGDIERTEKALGKRLVKKRRGGSEGGATELTDFGRILVERWEMYRSEVSSCLEKAFDEYLGDLIERCEDES
jgi:molybdate transport system regulatory protein